MVARHKSGDSDGGGGEPSLLVLKACGPPLLEDFIKVLLPKTHAISTRKKSF